MTHTAIRSVGFIGLGNQGLPMAVAIAEAGFELHVWDRRPSALDALEGVPHVAHDTVGELAAVSELVALCVPADSDVTALVRGPLIEHLRPGTVIVNHGTGTPRVAQELAAFAAERGVDVLDAPVSGGRAGATTHTLATFVGGDQTAALRAESVFKAFSSDVRHLGPSGAGQLAKLVNNALLMMNRANLAEVLVLLGEAGVDPIPVIEAVGFGSGASRALKMLPLRGGSQVADVAKHLTQVELLDMDIFDDAMHDLGIETTELSARARRGAASFSEVLHALNP